MNKQKRKLKRKHLVAMVLAAFIIGLASPTYALRYDLQPYTTCTNGQCSTSLDVSTLGLNTAKINALKTVNITNFLTKSGVINNFAYSWNGNVLTITGRVNDNVYWSFGSGGDTFDPWWNYTTTPNWWSTSWPYCRNLTITNPKYLYPARVNITNTTNMKIDFGDVRFINTSCGNGGSVLNYTLVQNKSSYAYFDVLLDSNTTSVISVYYGNPTATTTSSATSVFGSGLVFYNPLAEQTGSVAGDISGNSNNGTLAGGANAPSWKGNIGGGGLSFDGADYYTTTSSASLNGISAGISVLAWVNTSNCAANQFLIDKWDTAAYDNLAWLFKIKSDNTIGIETSPDGTTTGMASHYTKFNCTAGVMYQVGFTYSQSGGTSVIYVNGTQQSAKSIGTNKIYTSSVEPVWFAAANGGSEYLVGSMSAPMMWNRQLSSEEIRLLYSTIAAMPSFSIGSQTTSGTVSVYYVTELYLNGTQSNITMDNSTALSIIAYNNLTLNSSIYVNGTLRNNTISNATYTTFLPSGLYNITGYYFNASTNSTLTYWANMTYTAPAATGAGVTATVSIDLNAAPLTCLNTTHAVRNSTFINNGTSTALAELYFCTDGCDNVTNSGCMPPKWQTNLWVLVIVTVIIIALYKVYRWV